MHPDILIEALPDLVGKPLTTREADVVVGLRRFEHQDLVARSIGHLAFDLYACVAYLARHGEPDLGSGCAGHRLITLVDDYVLPEQAAWLAEHAGQAQVVRLRVWGRRPTRCCGKTLTGRVVQIAPPLSASAKEKGQPGSCPLFVL